MTRNKLMKKANAADKRLKKLVYEAFTNQFNEDVEKEKKLMKNPFYQLMKFIRKIISCL